MLRIAVCDDEPYIANQLAEQVSSFLSSREIPAELRCFSGGRSLLDSGLSPDILFLDVQMPAPDGFETALALRRRGFSGLLIFVTILREQVFRAFEVQAFDYLVKPLEPAAFTGTMERLLQTLRSGQEQRLLVQRGNDYTLIPFREIVYCEVINRKVYLHLHHMPVINYYEKLEVLETKLDSRFFRCHRSYLVNLQYLQSCRLGFAALSTGEEIPVSRLRREQLSAAVLQYMKQWRPAL